MKAVGTTRWPPRQLRVRHKYQGDDLYVVLPVDGDREVDQNNLEGRH